MNVQRMDRIRVMRGLALVEFVLVVPIILLVLMGGAELSRAIYQYNSFTKVVEGSTRYLAGVAIGASSGVVELDSTKTATAENLVKYGQPNSGGSPLLEGPVTFNAVGVPAVGATHVQVTATYGYQALLGTIPGFGYGEDYTPELTFSVVLTMRAL